MTWGPFLRVEIAAEFAGLAKGRVEYGAHVVRPRVERWDTSRVVLRPAEERAIVAGRPVPKRRPGRPAVVSEIGADPLDALLFKEIA